MPNNAPNSSSSSISAAFPQHRLRGNETLIFDLDDTLYPPGAFLSHSAFLCYVNEAVTDITGWPVAEVAAITEKYDARTIDVIGCWEREHNIAIAQIEDYIDKQDISHVPTCSQTQAFLRAWQGRSVIFTNTRLGHAERFLEHLGLTDSIAHICTNCQRGRRFKPDVDIYHELVARLDEKPENCIMFEDRHRNLQPAYDMGMGTVLIHPEKDAQEHVQLWYPDIKTWIQNVKIDPASQPKKTAL